MKTNDETKIVLPFMETIKRSFLFIVTNIKPFMLMVAPAFGLLVYEMLTGFPSICSLDSRTCVDDWRSTAAYLLLIVVSSAISVGCCRQIILKKQEDFFSMAFLKRLVRYLGYNMGILLLIAAPSFLVILTASFLFAMLNIDERTSFWVLSIIPVLLAIYLSKFFLVLPASAVDNREITLSKSFFMTKNNALRIFFGQAVLMIPGIVLLLALQKVYIWAAPQAYIVKFIFVALYLSLSFLDTGLKASFLSHVYQHFVPKKSKK